MIFTLRQQVVKESQNIREKKLVWSRFELLLANLGLIKRRDGF